MKNVDYLLWALLPVIIAIVYLGYLNHKRSKE